MTTSVFVSSTFADLRDHRVAVGDVIRRLGALDVAMEHLGARDERPKDECLRIVRDEAQLFVGIYAYRYGFVPADATVSITELEYLAATEAGISRLIFLVDEGAVWLPTLIERGDGEAKLASFKQRLKANHVCDFFATADDLAKRVATSVGRHLALQGLRNINSRDESGEAGTDVVSPQSAEQWASLRNGEYDDCRGVFLVHSLVPSSSPGQEFDIHIYLLRHKSEDNSDIAEAEFFLGHYWGNRVFRVHNSGAMIGIRVSA